MITEVLNERQQALRAEERDLLGELGEVLRRLQDPAAEGVGAAAGAVDEPFTLSLTGAREGALEILARSLVADPPPRDLAVVMHRPDESRAAGRPVDLALFLTSAHHPLAPAEHPWLRAAAAGAGRLLVVVDEAEMLRLSEDLSRMEEAVAVAAGRILGARPMVQMVSTARAGTAEPSRESLVPSLAGRVVGVLRSPEVFRPKLLHPLDSALDPARERRAAVEAGWAALADDLANLEVVEGEVQRLREAGERALREAMEEADHAVGELAERAGHLVRRGSRPFPLGLGLHRRFEEEAVAELREHLRRIGTGLEERIAEAVRSACQAVEDRVTSFPTERARGASSGGAGPAEAALPTAGSGPVVGELERTWQGGWDREAAEPVAAGLRRTSVLSLVLLLVGLAFAAVPVLSAIDGRAGLVAVALGGGLGGASVLAALATLKLGRRRLTDDLSRRLDELRAGAGAAVAAGAERAIRAAAAAVRAPVARYADAVAAERDRLAAARSDLERLTGRLEDLRRRVAAA